MANTLYNKIKSATQESQVQEVYNEAFKQFFNLTQIDRKFLCDGYFSTDVDGKNISVLIEYKYDIHMKDRVQRSKVFAQCVGYLKKFEEAGEPLPKVVFIGDINECCCVHTNDLLPFMDMEDIDWNISPCNLGDRAPTLVFQIASNLTPYVIDVNEDFNFKELIVDRIIAICNFTPIRLHITEKNIEKVYDTFCKRVLKHADKIPANDLVSIFIGCMLNNSNYFRHPTKKNTLFANGKMIQINGGEFDAFMDFHSTNYTPKEKRIFTSISDRLIEDTNRRNKGEFYTPTVFVDYAHKMITEQFGEHWKDNYVVWDCCCGTKNLTRDYRFKELYCSTLEQAELEISDKYNPEATSFQFDFLNDSLDDLKTKAPGLLSALENNKPILFFINPPYGASNNLSHIEKGSLKTKVSADMLENHIGGIASKNLYTQFLYRINKFVTLYKLSNCRLCVFCPPSFLTSTSCESFRKLFIKSFSFNNGVVFDSSEFSNVTFGSILLSLWKPFTNQIEDSIDVNIIKRSDNCSDSIISVGKRKIYSLSNDEKASYWFRLSDNDKEQVEFPNCTSGIKPTSGKLIVCKNFIGHLMAYGNNLFQSSQRTCLLSMPFCWGNSWSITNDNYSKAMIYFSARMLSYKTPYNQFDEIMIPNADNSHYSEFNNNAIVYSLFNGKSQQTSLRKIEYNDKLWDIHNNFFWMSKEEMLELAENNSNDECYNDALMDEDRFVYNKLKEIELSPEAQAVLDKATSLVKSSFKYRELFNESHPEYQINNWDCGWYQIKALLKEFDPTGLNEFKTLYNQLADKMRPMVYELGMLYR